MYLSVTTWTKVISVCIVCLFLVWLFFLCTPLYSFIWLAGDLLRVWFISLSVVGVFDFFRIIPELNLVCPCICLYVCLFVIRSRCSYCLSIFFVSVCVCLYVCLYIFYAIGELAEGNTKIYKKRPLVIVAISVFLCVCLSVCLSVCMYVWEVTVCFVLPLAMPR